MSPDALIPSGAEARDSTIHQWLYHLEVVNQNSSTLAPVPAKVTEDQLEALGRVGRALADATRCRILTTLLAGPAYPAEVAERLDLSRANVSNHLACLRGCGLVYRTAEGRQVRYELADSRLAHALADLIELVLTIDRAAPCIDDARG